MFEFTKRARKVLEIYAQSEGRRLSSDSLGPEHIMLALLKDEDSVAARICKSLNIDFDTLRQLIENSIKKTGTTIILGNVPISARFTKIIDIAKEEARKLKNSYIGTEHLLLAIFRDASCAGIDQLINSGIDYRIIKSEIIKILGTSSQTPVGTKPHEKVKTAVLDEFSINLTQLAIEGKIDPVIGRQKEIERVIRILTRKTKNNPILIGEAGVGKTAIVEGLAQRIVAGNVPESIAGKRIMSLDLPSIVAGTKYRGEFEDRLKRIIKEIKEANDIIIFIDELHTIIGAGAAEGAIDAANILKPALARGELQCIGATTINEYRLYIEKDAALERRFQTVYVDEPSFEETIEILYGIKSRYESFHKVKFSEEAIYKAVFLADRYIHDRFFPDKAIDLIDEAASKARFDNHEKPQDIQELEKEIELLNEKKNELVKMQEYEQAAAIRDKINELRQNLASKIYNWQQKANEYEILVTPTQIAQIVSQWTGIPVENMEESEAEKLLRMEDELHRRIIGQDDAIKTVCKAIRRSRTGLKNANRPIGSFVFLGPTGVGKTELAKALAEFLFDDETALIRIDMSEYMEKHSVSRLIGAPPGYIGYDDGGQLTEKVRRRPYSVILFDEIEKAHPDVFNILLQILEEGELTDNAGNTVSFRDTVIIMTSNAGSKDIATSIKMGFIEPTFNDQSKDTHFKELKRLFSPEFLNRLDEIIYFHPLTQKHIRHIVDLMLDEVNERLQEKGIELVFSAAVKNYLGKKGFDPQYGARFLRRTIQTEIEDLLATEILKGRFEDAKRIFVGLKNKHVYLKVIPDEQTEEQKSNFHKEKAQKK
ncbi:MAG: ATP-dependent Clp protease ATP-binding subunit [Spirochaetes bacterium]|nr:ATP-dependent Clp protease ATP-binding subunit [Spirochaetota bacterium]